MSISNNQITITTDATLVFAADPDGARVHVRVSGESYLGDEGVTIENGLKIKQNEFLSLFVGPDEQLYGIVDADTEIVYILATMNQ